MTILHFVRYKRNLKGAKFKGIFPSLLSYLIYWVLALMTHREFSLPNTSKKSQPLALINLLMISPETVSNSFYYSKTEWNDNLDEIQNWKITFFWWNIGRSWLYIWNWTWLKKICFRMWPISRWIDREGGR